MCIRDRYYTPGDAKSRYNANFTEDHVKVFDKFKKNVSDWGLIPKQPVKVKLESEEDMEEFISECHGTCLDDRL